MLLSNYSYIVLYIFFIIHIFLLYFLFFIFCHLKNKLFIFFITLVDENPIQWRVINAITIICNESYQYNQHSQLITVLY